MIISILSCLLKGTLFFTCIRIRLFEGAGTLRIWRPSTSLVLMSSTLLCNTAFTIVALIFPESKYFFSLETFFFSSGFIDLSKASTAHSTGATQLFWYTTALPLGSLVISTTCSSDNPTALPTSSLSKKSGKLMIIFVLVFLITDSSSNPGAWSAITNPSP